MLSRNDMTGLRIHCCLISRLVGRSFLILACVLMSSLITPPAVTWAQSGIADDDNATTSKTTITEITVAEVSDRESRLRNMEDELLKQLSVGGQPTEQDTVKPSLADIKEASEEIAAPKHAVHAPTKSGNASKPKPIEQAPATNDTPTKIQVVSYEEVPRVSTRAPQSASIVAVSAKTVQPRTSSPRARASTESLSAKDLEHRLAIAETQLNLLTQELESTKSKLAASEARVRELTDQISDGMRTSLSQSDTRSAVEARAAAVTIAERDTRPDLDAEVARTTKNKVPLRIGPGGRESIISHLSRDNVVTIERRSSGWYRVVTSDGARGWVSGNHLVFDSGTYSGSTVQVGAYEPHLEPTGGRY